MKKSSFLILAVFIGSGFHAFSQLNNSKKGEPAVIAEPGISEMQERYIEENKRRPEMEGFRVQIYNGTRQETLSKRTEFINVFPEVPVYTIYESPEYKVQTGDFRSRLEAEKFLKEVIARFGSGFVVETKIKLPALTPARDTSEQD